MRTSELIDFAVKANQSHIKQWLIEIYERQKNNPLYLYFNNQIETKLIKE